MSFDLSIIINFFPKNTFFVISKFIILALGKDLKLKADKMINVLVYI